MKAPAIPPHLNPSTGGHSAEEVERRAMEAARRLLTTPKPSKPTKSAPKKAAKQAASRDATLRKRQP